MNGKRTYTGRTAGMFVRLALIALLAGLLVVPAVVGAAPNDPLAGPTLSVSAPGRVAVGEPIELTLSLLRSSDLGGYEAVARFDTAAARFGGLAQRGGGLRAAGRDVRTLGSVPLTVGVAFGAYSCPVADCALLEPSAAPRAGPQGNLQLARLTVVPQQAGVLEIVIDAARFVDSTGAALVVANPDATLRIQVGDGGQLYAAPALTWARTGTGAPAPSADLSGDGRVSNADVMRVVRPWQLARAVLAPCGARPAGDVNGDGCVDVADVQTVAARYSSAPQPAPASPQAVNPPLVVNSNADSADAAPGNGVCATATGVCTLRAAIQEADRRAGADTINFNIPGSGVQTIVLTSELPNLTDESGGTTIDGYSQPGAAVNTSATVSNAVIRIQLEGQGEGSASSGSTPPSAIQFPALYVTSSNNVIRGLAMYKLWRKVVLSGSGAISNTLTGNFIGTNAAGTYKSPSRVENSYGAVLLELGAARNKVGGPAPAERNIISGNPGSGFYTHDEGTNSNTLYNNIMGLSPSAGAKLPNQIHAADINNGSSYNAIGANSAGYRNVMSGNNRSAVEISHDATTTNNRVFGNYIGTDVTGNAITAFSSNGSAGIHLEDRASSNEVAYNVIGKSGEGGIVIEGTGTRFNIIRNNWIGISPNGTYIANKVAGVVVRLFATNNTIGPANYIANNPTGVQIASDETPSSNDFNTITQNQIDGNTSLGIDLGSTGRYDYQNVTLAPHGVNALEVFDAQGPNQNREFPVLLAASPTQVVGTACAGCTVELFQTDGPASAYSSGRRYLGAVVVPASGRFTAAISGVVAGNFVTATATDATGNTSEFSLAQPVWASLTAPANYACVADTFTRTTSNVWGTANSGGIYSAFSTGASFATNGSTGRISIPTAGNTRSVYLLSRSAVNIDSRIKLQTDKMPAGTSHYAYVSARRTGTNSSMNEYRTKVRIEPDGDVFVQASRVVAGAETNLAGEVKVPGLVYTAGMPLWFRAAVSGTGTTVLQLKVWADGTAEPATWQYTSTDGTSALQQPGALGVRAYIGATATNAPVLFTFDDWSVVCSGTPPA